MHAIATTVPLPLDQTEAVIRVALADQAFGEAARGSGGSLRHAVNGPEFPGGSELAWA